MPTREELIASNRVEDEVRHSITATTLHHISLSALIDAIGFERDNLCTGCLTGCYPVQIDGEEAKMRQVDFVNGTYQSKLGSFDAEST
jgi:amidophosphoribosyltransferase